MDKRQNGLGIGNQGDPAYTLDRMATQGVAVQQPMCLMDQGGSVMQVNTDGTTGTLRRETHGHEPVVVVQQPTAFSISPGVNRGKQTKDDLFVAPQDTSRTLDTQGANPERHQGGTVIVQQPMVFQSKASSTNSMNPGSLAPTLDKSKSEGTAVFAHMAVRRLTPVECERLQGFPDGWTDIKPGGKDTPDSPRYKALGNSMAVPVMAWIGRRIEARK